MTVSDMTVSDMAFKRVDTGTGTKNDRAKRSKFRPPANGYRLWIGGPVPPGADAITLGQTIIARRRVSASPTFEQLLRHELTHVEQWRQLGYLAFLRRYVGEYLSGRLSGLRHHDAYLNISLERQARDRAAGRNDPPTLTLADVAAAHRRIEQLMQAFTAEDFARPSHLPDWTVGHVVAHVVGNARALGRVLGGGTMQPPDTPATPHAPDTPDAPDAHITERPTAPPMTALSLYDSLEHRAAGINELRALPHTQLISELHHSNQRFEAAWSAADPHLLLAGTTSAVPGGEPFPVANILDRRLREAEVHAADCGDRRYTYEMWSDAFVNHELATRWPELHTRVSSPVHVVDETGMHHTTLGGVRSPAQFATRRAIVAWLLGRAQPASLPVIEPW